MITYIENMTIAITRHLRGDIDVYYRLTKNGMEMIEFNEQEWKDVKEAINKME